MGEGLDGGLIYHLFIYLFNIMYPPIYLFICFQASDCPINVYHNIPLVYYVSLEDAHLDLVYEYYDHSTSFQLVQAKAI